MKTSSSDKNLDLECDENDFTCKFAIALQNKNQTISLPSNALISHIHVFVTLLVVCEQILLVICND